VRQGVNLFAAISRTSEGKRKMKLIPLAIAAGLVAFPAAAQDHSGHMQKVQGEAGKAYMAAMDKMHEAMSSMDYSGDPDIDFVRGMIPHHEAAVEMAETLLKYGKDRELRKMAEEIVSAQQREISQMQDWLEQHPVK